MQRKRVDIYYHGAKESKPCPECHGTGKVICHKCKGTGTDYTTALFGVPCHKYEDCPTCNGSGSV